MIRTPPVLVRKVFPARAQPTALGCSAPGEIGSKRAYSARTRRLVHIIGPVPAACEVHRVAPGAVTAARCPRIGGRRLVRNADRGTESDRGGSVPTNRSGYGLREPGGPSVWPDRESQRRPGLLINVEIDQRGASVDAF